MYLLAFFLNLRVKKGESKGIVRYWIIVVILIVITFWFFIIIIWPAPLTLALLLCYHLLRILRTRLRTCHRSRRFSFYIIILLILPLVFSKNIIIKCIVFKIIQFQLLRIFFFIFLCTLLLPRLDLILFIVFEIH